jgi:hypothetical protein
MPSPGSLLANSLEISLGILVRFPNRGRILQKRQTSWRTKWDSNLRFGQTNFAFENSTEFRASVDKLGP